MAAFLDFAITASRKPERLNGATGLGASAGSGHCPEAFSGHRAVTGAAALRPGRFCGPSGEFRLDLRKVHEPRSTER